MSLSDRVRGLLRDTRRFALPRKRARTAERQLHRAAKRSANRRQRANNDAQHADVLSDADADDADADADTNADTDFDANTAVDADAAELAYLESRLGIIGANRGRVNDELAADGLDEIVALCDTIINTQTPPRTIIQPTPPSPPLPPPPPSDSTSSAPPLLISYQPPQRRATDSSSSRVFVGRVLSALNRVSAENTDSIARELAAVYRLTDVAAGDVTAAVVSSVIQRVVDQPNSRTLDFAGLVAALSRITDADIALAMIQAAVEAVDTRRSVDAVRLIVDLYRLDVTDSKLVIQMANALADDIDTVDALTAIVVGGGYKLRRESPAELKETFQLISARAPTMRSPHVAILLEAIRDIKHNKRRADVDAAERIRSRVAAVTATSRAAVCPLSIPWRDIVECARSGRRWRVNTAATRAPTAAGDTSSSAALVDADGDIDLRALSRAAGLTRPLQSRVLSIICSAADYCGAAERINKLRLTDAQYRDVVGALIRCALLEPKYNPYYALVLRQLAANVRSIRFTAQIALWDAFQRLDGVDAANDRRAAAHLAQLIVQCIDADGRGLLDLSVLRGLPAHGLLSEPLALCHYDIVERIIRRDVADADAAAHIQRTFRAAKHKDVNTKRIIADMNKLAKTDNTLIGRVEMAIAAINSPP